MSRGGIILGALSGASDAILKGMDADRDQANAESRMRLASSLEQEKLQAIEAIKAAPLNRLQSRAQALAGQDVPQEAQKVSSLSGTYASDEGPSMGGFVGDVKNVQSSIAALPEGKDKQAAIDQLKRQVSQGQSANNAAVEGMTRKRTSGEAFDLALDEAKAGDLQAYIAGRSLKDDKTPITIPYGATVIDRSGKVIFNGSANKDQSENAREDRRDARESAKEDARDARQQRYLDARERMAELQKGRGDNVSREERLRYTSLFNETGRRMSDIQKTINTLRANPMYAMAKDGSPQARELEGLQAELKTYQEERSTYGRLLSGSQADQPTGQAAAQPSAKTPSPQTDPMGLFKK